MGKKRKSMKSRGIAVFLTFVLVFCMLPLDSVMQPMAQTISKFTVTLSGYNGIATVTLTQKDNIELKQTAVAENGVATFNDYIDDTKVYTLTVSEMVGYKDYTKDITIAKDQIDYKIIDLEVINKVKISGKVIKEDNSPYVGATVTYSGYLIGNATTSIDGSYSFEVYPGHVYNLVISGSQEFDIQSLVLNNPANNQNLGTTQLLYKRFQITTNTDTAVNGTITSTVSDVKYGDSKEIIAKAKEGYRIGELKVNNQAVAAAVGQQQYTCSISNIKENYNIEVTFIRKTYEITFTYGIDGKVVDKDSNLISDGGNIVVNEGDSTSFTAIANTNYHVSELSIMKKGVETFHFSSNKNEDNSYAYTFSKLDDTYTVSVMFEINTFDITIRNNQLYGTIQYNGSDVGTLKNVKYGENLPLRIIPKDGFSIESIYLDGGLVNLNDANLVDNNDETFTYNLNNIVSLHTVEVTYQLLTPADGEENTLFTFNSADAKYNYTDQGKRIYVYSNNTQVLFKPGDGYMGIKINSDNSFSNPRIIYQNTEINTVKLKRPGCFGPITSKLQNPIIIYFDQNAPVVDDISPLSWSKDKINGVLIKGTVSDDTPTDSLKIVWSPTKLSSTQVLAETTNLVTPDLNGNYSIQMKEEQNTTYYIYAYDKVGNVSAAKTVNVKIDLKNPTITGYKFSESNASVTDSLINYLTFGTFCNKNIYVTITAADETVSSGLKEITLYSDDKVIETKNVNGTNAIFEIKATDFNGKVISAKVSDIAGNESVITKPTEVGTTNTKAVSNQVMIESVVPTVAISPAAATFKDSSNNLWYNQSTEFAVSTGDVDSGIYSVVIKLNGKELATDITGKAIKANFYASLTKSEDFKINTSQNQVDGKNTIEVTVKDNCGNTKTLSKDVYLDTTKPGITGFQITKVGGGSLSKTLNFLSFGIFYNEKVEVTVTANDKNASAGLKDITLYADNVAISKSPKSVSDGKAVFEVPLEVITNQTKLIDKTLSAVSTDNVNNTTATAVMPSDVNSDIKNSGLMIETVSPEINIEASTQVYTDLAGNNWYQKDIPLNITTGDVDSGIRSVSIAINGTELSFDKNNKAIHAQFYLTETHQELFVINTDQGVRAQDGSYTIKVMVTDNCGNTFEKTKVVYKDDTNPYITSFQLHQLNGENATATSDGVGNKPTVEITEYGYYFIQDTEVTIYSKDDIPSSGIHTITYYTVDKDTGKSQEKTLTVDADNKIKFTIGANFKGQIYAKATDHVNNSPVDFVNPNSAIIENTQKHLEEKHIVFNMADTKFTDNNGRMLYADNTNVKLTVSDTYSGIRNVEWSVIAPYDTDKNQSGKFVINNDKTYAAGSNTDGWQQTATDKNLVTQMSKTLTVSNNSNGIIVKAKITDRAGNVSEEQITLSIDKTKPTIVVTYDNNTPDPDNNQFYKGDRTATIVVTERNFRPQDVAYQINNSDGIIPNLSGWTQVENPTNPDNTTHTATIQYTADGDYTFGMDYHDNAMNTAPALGQHQFTIDKTMPVINVSYNNNNSLNGNYYAADRTATIVITEHNFDTSRIVITGTATDNNNPSVFPNVNGWNNEGDIHTATINYNADSKYSFDITYKDMSGNEAADYLQEEFYIDKTAPTIVISGIADKSANKGDVIPVVSYNDTNFNWNGVNVSLTGSTRGNVAISGNYGDAQNGQIFTFENFEKSKEVDDIYLLNARVVDFAGNETTQAITFSVNRFGSTYTLDDTLKTIEGKYIQGEEDLVLTEINVDNLKHETIKLKVIKNGTPIDLVEGRDYTIVQTGGSGQWSQYKYVVKKALFSGDGKYTLTVYSEDSAGNINENINENKKAEIAFGVDKTAPVIVPIDFDSNLQYAVNSKRVSISVNDNLLLNNVIIYLNNEKIDYVQEGESYSFEIPSMNSKQAVKVVAIDLAGNQSMLEINNFLVSTNLFVRWYNNKTLFIGSIAGTGLVVVLLAAVIVFRKKKTQ